ncbi:MAG TPA: trypsin-like peptidase domain-containing protein [Bryobacteraceae bacterium]|jgi:S1-C subfamily serine protease|nr:trypsin-like peptidase domain-containing protein [Bryobacteraceae bacterium]
MKLRVFVITALLVSGFLFVTTKTDWGQRRLSNSANGGPLWSGPSEAHATSLSADENNNIDIYKNAHTATVNITSTIYRRTIFFEVYPSKDQGSGFLISQDGKILTNSHVVANERQLEVTLPDQSRYKATLLSRDEANDVALLQIQPRGKLPTLRLGDSDGLQVGQKVLAIGNPFGLEGTLTVGIVSSLGRSIRGENERTLEGLIQTDAAINPGNSGGPLLDSAGNVVGINTAILGPNGNIGIGFAMPINRAKLMLDDFQAGRKRPKLGVSVVPISGDYADALSLPTQGGLLIQEVDADSAAARAGLRGGRQEVQIGNAQVLVGGDLIMSIDGQPVERDDAISRALAKKRTGDTLELTIFRNGRTINVRIKLGEEGAI